MACVLHKERRIHSNKFERDATPCRLPTPIGSLFCVGVPSGGDQAAGYSFTAGLPHKTHSGSVCGGRPLPAERRSHERQRVRPSPVEHAI